MSVAQHNAHLSLRISFSFSISVFIFGFVVTETITVLPSEPSCRSGWCSGYHARFTRERSRVRTPHPIFCFSDCYFYSLFIIVFMTCLLDLDYDGRKQFVWDRLRTVPEWEDVCSINDFSMEQNKGMLLFLMVTF